MPVKDGFEVLKAKQVDVGLAKIPVLVFSTLGQESDVAKAKKLGDRLVVIVNNDHQVKLKGKVPFLNQADRVKIISAIKWVDKVFLSIDRDPSVCKSLAKVKPDIFAQGGDRKKGNIPEAEEKICRRLRIKRVDG